MNSTPIRQLRIQVVTAIAVLVVSIWGAAAYQVVSERQAALRTAAQSGRNLSSVVAEHFSSYSGGADLLLQRLRAQWTRDPKHFAQGRLRRAGRGDRRRRLARLYGSAGVEATRLSRRPGAFQGPSQRGPGPALHQQPRKRPCFRQGLDPVHAPCPRQERKIRGRAGAVGIAAGPYPGA